MTTEQFRQRFIAPPLTNRELYPTKLITNSCIFFSIPSLFAIKSESIQPSQLEHLCINLCAETMQHFFNTHIFKSSIESCREEGIQCELEPDYVDNVPCIDLISSLVLDILPFNAGWGDERIGFLSSNSI